MVLETKENLVHIIILDISGIYAQIYNDGYFDKSQIESIKEQYSNEKRWRVVIVDWQTKH